ncbi:aminoglycoside phosphotransferase family protein [Agrobacterium vitis]|uniref:aminoglycoside phosphotransferase family protein n=1 Tax=Agrobacterium vitis TaxID=373 RepID=UPI0020360E85|nr:aminoglycoside phosphotransferase family protein [Agrobacterium vitis]MCM2451501.1 streptomycin resistance protein [Agrobacterium vitis]
MKAPVFPPSLVERWALSHIRLIADTPSSHVYRATRDERPVVVKALKPEGSGERPGLDFLRWRSGNGAIKLIDQADDIALLDDAGDLMLRHHLGKVGDPAATEIIVKVLARLHAPSPYPVPDALMPLKAHFNALFALEKTMSDPAIAEIIHWTAALARSLLAEQQDIKPLHGDLHHDNVIGDHRGNWLAIDPQRLLGDPAYDVANIFGNPLHAPNLVLDPQRAINLSQRFSLALGCSPRKILSYAAAHAGLSCAWTLSRPLTASGNTNLAERLGFARLARSILAEQFVD